MYIALLLHGILATPRSVGYDKYNTIYNRYDGLFGVPNEDAITSIFYQLVDLTGVTKMVAMTENDTVPSLSNLTEESI